MRANVPQRLSDSIDYSCELPNDSQVPDVWRCATIGRVEYTTGAGGDQRAVGIEDGLVEEVGRLLAPEFEPSLIEDVLEGFDVVGGEAAAEVARGGGVGDAVGPRASRKTRSLRRCSMSSRQVPSHRAL